MTAIGTEVYTRITRRTKTEAMTYTSHEDVTAEWDAMRAIVEAAKGHPYPTEAMLEAFRNYYSR